MKLGIKPATYLVAIVSALSSLNAVPVSASSSIIASGYCGESHNRKLEGAELKEYLGDEYNYYAENYPEILENYNVEEYGDNLQWRLDDEGTLTISGNGMMYSFFYMADGQGGGPEMSPPWAGNASESTNYSELIKKVVIEDGVTSIGCCAFSTCPNLESISIADSVVIIESRAFWGTKWLYNQPDGMIYINNCAYKWKGSIPQNTEIIIRDGTDYICPSCFIPCESYLNTQTGEQMYFENYREFNLDNISKIAIPDTVLDLQIVRDWKWYQEQPDGLVRFENSIVGYKGNVNNLEELNIKDGILGISSNAFGSYWEPYDKCTNLKSAVIPDSVRYIGSCAFAGLPNLKSIT
ncbi:MAG: leucine-rich repeat domain-containing protein, partial [Oscillospiraceae bacterium]|nr:leucine-rich repeat domain-containing protein [Oscillospiraceae bacterium]